MTFDPAHHAAVAWAPDPDPIIESPDGTVPAQLPPIPSTPTLIGYTNLPQTGRGFNNRKGYAVGAAGAAYTARGRIEPTVGMQIRLGSLGFLPQCLRPTESDPLPEVAIFVIVKNQFTLVYRKAKCNQLTLEFAEGTQSGGELTASPTFWAQGVQNGSLMNPTPAQLRALGTPLFFHDVRSWNVGAQNLRSHLMRQSWTVNHNLERKSQRSNWGDDDPLSRTCFHILEHHITVTGEMSLHQRMPRDFIDNLANAHDWGSIVTRASDGPGLPNGGSGRAYNVTATNVVPTDETMQGGESSTQIQHSVPVAADNLQIDLS